jgi:HD-like signal output (HDOD) protein
MSDAISALLDRVTEVCPLPVTAQKVMTLANSERANIGEIAEIIATDPALAASVLRVANAAIFGGGGKVDRLDAGIMRIGLRGVRDLAGAMSLLAAFRSQAELQLQLHDYSVMSGSIANRIAKELGSVVTATAFTSGLLSEIGAMACIAVDGMHYVSIWKETVRSTEERISRETERYSVTSFEIGRRFLERNNLPESICSAIGSVLGTDPSELQLLDQVTLFARHAGPVVLIAAAEGALDDAVEQLGDLSRQVGLTNFDGRSLLEICVRAGAIAESQLKRAR